MYDDFIRRQAAIDFIDAGYLCNPNEPRWSDNEVVNFLKTRPSAQPQRKKGKWIPVTNGRGGFECDECHNYAPSFQDGVEWLSDYCPNCGADMRGEKDE